MHAGPANVRQEAPDIAESVDWRLREHGLIEVGVQSARNRAALRGRRPVVVGTLVGRADIRIVPAVRNL